MRLRFILIASLTWASNAFAQEGEAIAPLYVAPSETHRMAAPSDAPDPMLTTRRDAAQPAVNIPAPQPAVIPFGAGSGVSQPPTHYATDKVPFGHAQPLAPAIPAEPHTATATPVDDVDSIDATEPAPPTPVTLEENPVAQDPTEPTELTSPIFDKEDGLKGPRKITLRVLNKVTAQSQLVKANPGDTVKFGKLEVTATTCRVSAPNSLTDYAGLFDISELPAGSTDGKKKPLFHGWMYASSPSIAALEHPIYDVTMVSCDSVAPAAKVDDKSGKKADKKAKK